MPLGTPYVTPEMIVSAPTGVSWSIIPFPKASSDQQLQEQMSICWRATSAVDTYCSQVLRSTCDNEQLSGPGMPRCTVDRNTGTGTLVMSRWPVTSVLAIQTSPSRSFPRVWTPVPAGLWDIRHPLISAGDSASATAPDGGWTVDVAPGYISWRSGRGGLLALVSYFNGWPHTSLTEASVGGAETLTVDDVTGWAAASGFVYDGASTEQVSVLSVEATAPAELPNGAGTAQSGPGTITLSAPLAFGHDAGTVVSALPATAMDATILACASEAMTGGLDAVTIQSISGGTSSSGDDVESITKRWHKMLDKFLRVI